MRSLTFAFLAFFSVILTSDSLFVEKLDASSSDLDIVGSPPQYDGIRLLEMQYTAAVVEARRLRSEQIQNSARLERIRSQNRKSGPDFERLPDSRSPDLSSISFPFGHLFSSIPTLLEKPIPVSDRRASKFFESPSSKNVTEGLSLIEDAILNYLPFPLNFVFVWWSNFRGFRDSGLPGWRDGVAKLATLKSDTKPTSFYGQVAETASDLLPFPFKFLADWRKLDGREVTAKHRFLDGYDDARIAVEEADRRVTSLLAPWLPWPHNKLAFLVFPFRGRRFGRNSTDGDGDGEWRRALDVVSTERPVGGRDGRGLLGLFGLSPLQFFPMLTPLNLFGKSFNSSGPRPFTLQIYLPENKTLKFSNEPQTLVNITTNVTTEEKVKDPNYNLDLKYYYKVYPSPPPTPSTFNPDVYNEDVSKRVSEALVTFEPSLETTTEPMLEDVGTTVETDVETTTETEVETTTQPVSGSGDGGGVSVDVDVDVSVKR